jgi:class 3 adenylate cyclase
VTAGALRGDKSRFQLFGDAMNTTARIETTGEPNHIHISTDTAKQIMNAGKEHWMTPRADKVVAKGKGEMTTYWLNLRERRGSSSAHSISTDVVSALDKVLASPELDYPNPSLSDKENRQLD